VETPLEAKQDIQKSIKFMQGNQKVKVKKTTTKEEKKQKKAIKVAMEKARKEMEFRRLPKDKKLL